MITYPNVVTLIIALRTEDRRTHTLVVDDLVRLGSSAVEPLLAVLDDPNPYVRAGAARALGKIGDLKALDALVYRLRYDPDAEVRKSAVWALHMGGEYAITPLIDALCDADEWVRFGAVIVLSKLGRVVVEPLIEALNHSDPLVRMSVAETLGRVGDIRAADALAGVLTDMHELVWQQVAISLGRLRDARAVNPLMAIVRDPDSDFRTKAIRALGYIQDVRAVDLLIDMVYDGKDRWMRLFAIEALGQIGDIRAVEALLDAVYDDSRDLRVKALVTLGEIPYALALDALYMVVEDARVDAEEQQTALFELGKRHDPRAVEGLIDLLLYSAQADTRIYAALVLSEMGEPHVIEALIEALSDEVTDVASQAMESLVKLGQAATSPLVIMLSQSASAERRVWAVRVLGQIASEEAVNALVGVALNGAEQWWVREEARDILYKLGYIPPSPG